MGYITLMSSNVSETAVCGSLYEDLNDWEVIPGCHHNWTSVSQLIETSVYFQLVRCKSSDIICQPRALHRFKSSLPIRRILDKSNLAVHETCT